MKNDSPYSAAITGCGFMFREMESVLPLLVSPDRDELLKEEVKNGDRLMIKSESSRKRAISEFKRRYAAVPASFWIWYVSLDDKSKRVAMFYVILKTYKIVFDLHFNVVVPRWNSVDQTVTKQDVYIGFNEIAATDPFVDSWSDQTRDRISSAVLSILRKVGLLDEKNDSLSGLDYSDVDFTFYVENGENWFFDACMLQPFEVERIKNRQL